MLKEETLSQKLDPFPLWICHQLVTKIQHITPLTMTEEIQLSLLQNIRQLRRIQITSAHNKMIHKLLIDSWQYNSWTLISQLGMMHLTCPNWQEALYWALFPTTDKVSIPCSMIISETSLTRVVQPRAPSISTEEEVAIWVLSSKEQSKY